MAFDLSDLNKLDDIIFKDLEKEKTTEKRKHDAYDDYKLLFDKQKKKKKITDPIKPGGGGDTGEKNVEQLNKHSVTSFLFDNHFHNNYIFNNYEFLKEHVYINNLTVDDLFYKKEETIIIKQTEQKKLLTINKDIDDFIKVYDINNQYPPIYLKKLNHTNEENKENDIKTKKNLYNMKDNFFKRNKEEFRITLERVMLEIKEEKKIRQERQERKKYDLLYEQTIESSLGSGKGSNMINVGKGKEKENGTKNEYIENDYRDKNNNQNNINFVEKYRAKFFSELLTDESINIEVLLWLKKWVQIIEKEKKNTLNKKINYNKLGEEEDDDDEVEWVGNVHKGNDINSSNNKANEKNKSSDQFPRILLLGGSAGKGKTTLAYVISKHFNFNVIEINGSDDRNKETLIPFIESIVCNNSINSKSNICIIDEIDGLSSSQQNIDGILKFLNKKDKKNKSIIKRPIICICNDIYHKSLKELRKISKVVIVEEINKELLQTRILSICEKENIKISNDVINKLIEIYKCDIRSILNTIYFLSIGAYAVEQDKGKIYDDGESGSYGYKSSNNKKHASTRNKKVNINMEFLNAYIFFKDANNNYMELLKLIYIKNKNKKEVKKSLKECYNFFFINLSNEYNYLQSYYYIYDNLLHIPFNDFNFLKLSYCLDFFTLCDTIEYEQKQILNYSLQKMLYLVVYLFIIIININTNTHVQYIHMNNSTSNYYRKKEISNKQLKHNFINEKFAVITYKYVYSKHFYFELLNYIFSFFYMNGFFYERVHIWGKQNYFDNIDLPLFILAPYEQKDFNKFKTFCVKILYIMTLFNISFTSLTVFPQQGAISNENNSNHTNDKLYNDEKKQNNKILNNYQTEKVYIFDPHVEDILLFAEKRPNIFSNKSFIPQTISNINSNIGSSSTKYNESFNFTTDKFLLNKKICEVLNEFKNWINNNSIK
uniref:AAA+ ATPase domain-containing protein n=1 Tax=Piliocolobus tephrosceles TaxID=591936 RepID=A0A8C9GM33_9PRIM